MPPGPGFRRTRCRRLICHGLNPPLAVLLLLATSGCAPDQPHSATGFPTDAAMAHVEFLAGAIGSRWVGTRANELARSYIVEELRRAGFEVRVQETDASRPEYGVTTRVANIIGTSPGKTPAAIALVSHYDSVPESPGAADAALGVAVALEAGRVLAKLPDRSHTLVVAITDAEEVGLMGAAALVADPAFAAVRAFLNFEAIGSSGPPLLFEAGPRNAWIVEAWARAAPFPAGTSLAREIYARLPNDTDFTILERSGTPGLNFAPVGDSYTYHTRNDRPDRLSRSTLAEMGANAIRTVESLDRMDLSRRSDEEAVYFDVEGVHAFALTPFAAHLLSVAALAAAAVSWIRLVAALWRLEGLSAIAMSALWTAGTSAVFGTTLVATAWIVRKASGVYHPWYAHPSRFHVLLILSGAVVVWLLGIARSSVRATLRGSLHPAARWVLALPAWAGAAVTVMVYFPGASYLTSIPLLAAGAFIAAINPRTGAAIRIVSVIVLAVAGAVVVRPAAMLLEFLAPVFGRFPIVTPVYAHPLLVAAAALYAAPPLAAIAGRRDVSPGSRRVRTWQAVLVASALAAAAASVFASSPYTPERPERRAARYVQDGTTKQVFWEVAGREPGLNLAGTESWLAEWREVSGSPPTSAPIDAAGGPFIYRLAAPGPLVEPPARVSATLLEEAGETVLDVAVIPRQPGMRVDLYLPRGIEPAGSNLPGVATRGGWRAIYVAPPPEGIRFSVKLTSGVESLPGARVVLWTAGVPEGRDLPGGSRVLPDWLPQHRVAWTARSVFVLPVFERPTHG